MASSLHFMKNLRARLFTSRPAPPFRPKVSVLDIQKFYREKRPLTMVTAYTYPSAVHVDTAGIDMILVGDSVAMVEQGHDTTQPVTVDQMIYHCQAVSRGASRALLVGDMPFGSYESSINTAYNNSIRFLKEAGMDCVKLEGGRERAETVKHLVDGGVAVMGHIGLTPQRISVLGGFRAQGRTSVAAMELIDTAIALQKAGAFDLVVECVPPQVAKAITEAIQIPTIGIGSGPYTSGQVLVYHDLLGFLQHAHHAQATPRFCKKYAKVGEMINEALQNYRDEVRNQTFPGETYSPYTFINKEEEELFQKELQRTYQQRQPKKK